MPESSDSRFWQSMERIAAVRANSELRAAIQDALEVIGFRAAYFLAPVVADPRVGRIASNIGFDSTWEERYREHDVLIDPLPQIVITRQSAFVWPDDIDLALLSGDQKDYLQRIAQFGLDRGIAVPCFGPFARCGFVGVGAAIDDAPFTAETVLKVETCARVSFQRYVQLVRPFDDMRPTLSLRETEVLQWIAQGKSNAVIAQLLEISASSVDVYVKRIFAKLGVADRTSAAVHALALGLVVSGDYPRSATLV